MRQLSLICFTLLFPCILSAQSVKANELLKKGDYATAATLFEKAVETNQPAYEDLSNLAYCYIMLHEFVKAEDVYVKIIAHPKKESNQHFFYAEILRVNGKYSQAKEQYKIYQTAYPDDFKSEQRIKSCDSIPLWNSIDTKTILSSAPGINTPFEEMYPWQSPEGLYFSSTSKDLLCSSGGNSSFQDPQIAFIFKNKGSKTEFVKINLTDSSSISAYCPRYGSTLLVTKKIRVTANGEEMSHSSIKESQGSSFADFAPENAPDGYIFSQPCLALGGKRLYFASDMPGGLGGTDIYYSDFANNKWGAAVNAGNLINTPGNEMFPYITENDSFFYFASDGLPGYGNLDIFVSVIDNGKWGNPRNLKKPINSIGNDFSLTYSSYPNQGYLVSNRYPESKGGTDIFAFEIKKPIVVKPDTTNPFVYKADNTTLYTFFQTGSTLIDPRFNSMLDSIADLMKKYNYLNLNLTAFADVRGGEQLNDKLVGDRENAIVAYFVAAGVGADRIIKNKGKISEDRQIPGIRFHTQIGFVTRNDAVEYFEWKTQHKYSVSVLKKANGYAYFTGVGTISEMQGLVNEINAGYAIGSFIIASYRNVVLDDTWYAPNRRAELSLFNK